MGFYIWHFVKGARYQENAGNYVSKTGSMFYLFSAVTGPTVYHLQNKLLLVSQYVKYSQAQMNVMMNVNKQQFTNMFANFKRW